MKAFNTHALLFALAALGLTASNGAPATELAFVAIAQDGIAGVDGLNGAAAIAIAPDGRQVVAAGSIDNALAVFERDPTTGALAFLQAVRTGGLVAASGLAYDPDGRHVYATAANGNEVSVFARDEAAGSLSFVQAVRNGVSGVMGLASPRQVTVAPEGTAVYVTAAFDDAVTLFDRDPASGELSFVETLTSGTPAADGQGTIVGLGRANGLTLAPGGQHLYVASPTEDAIAIFARANDGRLVFLDAVIDGMGGTNGIDQAEDIAISPDGRHAVVASRTLVAGTDWLTLFHRDPVSGGLSFAHALPNPPLAGGCQPGLIDPAARLAFASDGRRLYAAAAAHQGVAALRIDADGHLHLLQVACNGAAGTHGLLAASGVAVPSDGRHLYATALFDNSLVTLAVPDVVFSDGFESGDLSAWLLR